MRQRTTGFSLIELLVVLVIIGVLAGIAVPSYKDYVRGSKMAEAATTLHGIGKGILAELRINGAITGDFQGINISGSSTLSGPSSDLVEGYRIDGNGNDMYWMAARIPTDIVSGAWQKREIHMGFVRDGDGEWHSICGSWSSGFMDEEYLPKGCNETNIGSQLASMR